MKEHPILFSAPMVRAILEGRKTQTRRVVKAQPYKNGSPEHWSVSELPQFCPYGQPGDQLWVRETFHFQQGGPIYDAAGSLEDSIDDELIYRATSPNCKVRWKPSIFMPRWASRITLEITAVRVERLQDISPADCVCEGYQSDMTQRYAQEELAALNWYRALWESINGADSWAANPWVWVVEFRRAA